MVCIILPTFYQFRGFLINENGIEFLELIIKTTVYLISYQSEFPISEYDLTAFQDLYTGILKQFNLKSRSDGVSKFI